MSKEDLASRMKSLVGQYRESGQPLKAFALAHGISEAKLSYWIKKLSKTGHGKKKAPPASGFVPLEFQPAPSRARGYLVIRLNSGVEIEIPL